MFKRHGQLKLAINIASQLISKYKNKDILNIYIYFIKTNKQKNTQTTKHTNETNMIFTLQRFSQTLNKRPTDCNVRQCVSNLYVMYVNLCIAYISAKRVFSLLSL